jgi:hypothetical protein
MSKFNAAYGARGGSIIPFTANDAAQARCADCDRLLLAVERKQHACNDCTKPPETASLF